MDDDLYDFGGSGSTPSYYTNNSSSYSASTKHSDPPSSYSSYTSSSSTTTTTTATTTNYEASYDATKFKRRPPGSSAVYNDSSSDKLAANTITDTTAAAAAAAPATSTHPLGFCDVDVPPLTIQSEWRRGQRARSMECQTNDILTSEIDTQTSTKSDASIQTSDHGSGPSVDPKGSVYAGFDAWSPETEDLKMFLRWSCAEMESQLSKNDRSTAFDDYDLGSSPDDLELACLHVLAPMTMQNVKTVAQVLEEERREAERDESRKSSGGGRRGGSSSSSSSSDFAAQGMDLQATSMSWNSTGSVLAVAYGRLDESGWCNITRAGCCLYHVFQRDFQPTTPQTVLETSSYLMSVCCHPEIPSLIAGGTFNGEVVVWDTSLEGEDRLVGASCFYLFFCLFEIVFLPLFLFSSLIFPLPFLSFLSFYPPFPSPPLSPLPALRRICRNLCD